MTKHSNYPKIQLLNPVSEADMIKQYNRENEWRAFMKKVEMTISELKEKYPELYEKI